jgi:hypothetical protein
MEHVPERSSPPFPRSIPSVPTDEDHPGLVERVIRFDRLPLHPGSLPHDLRVPPPEAILFNKFLPCEIAGGKKLVFTNPVGVLPSSRPNNPGNPH